MIVMHSVYTIFAALLMVSLVLQTSHSAAVLKPLPVVIFHGIFSGPEYLDLLKKYIEDALPGVEVYNIDGFNNFESTTNMWKQLEGIRAKMIPIFEKHPDGVNMICYSQGGLTCRGVLQTTPNHSVKTFILLSSPQAGQFGDTDFLSWIVPNVATELIYKVFYSPLAQEEISIANYWRDPHQVDLYQKRNTYLPALNGLAPLTKINGSSLSTDFKTNFLQLEHLVMIGGPHDGVITPWQSSHYSFYDDSEKVLEYQSQEYYIKDTFGLRTLDEAGKTHIHEVPGVEHLHWPLNYTVFTNYILPYIKPA